MYKKWCLLLCSVMIFSVGLYGQNQYTLREGIAEVASGLSKKLPAGTKVVIIDIRAETPEASAFIVEELTYRLLDVGTLRVVDRESLAVIRSELTFQTSGDVSDESAQRLGAMLGAEALITGSFDYLNGKNRLAIKSVKVETSEILYMAALSIQATSETDALLGRKSSGAAAVTAVGSAAKSVADFSARLFCSSINPFFGIGSYIQGDFQGGRTVTFWELLGAGLAAYGGYKNTEGETNAPFFVAAGGFIFSGAVVYAYIRPWRYNRDPDLSIAPQEGFNLAFGSPALNTVSQDNTVPVTMSYTVRY